MPVSENLQVRVAAHKQDHDGYQTNVANNALNGEDYRDEHVGGARISVNFQQDKLSNLLVLAKDRNNVRAGVPVASATNTSVAIPALAAANGIGPNGAAYLAAVARQVERDNPWKVETDIDSKEYVQNVFASNTTEFELNDNLTVKNIVGYRKVKFDGATDADGTGLAYWGTPPDTANSTAVTLNPKYPTTLGSEFYSEEVQLLGTAMDDKLDWIVGAYASNTDSTQDYNLLTSPFSYDVGTTDAINKSYGLFGETTYSFNDQWSLTTGLRQSWDKREMTVSKYRNLARTACQIAAEGVLDSALGANSTVLPSQVAPGCERSVNESYDAPTWRVSANYTPEEGTLMYASVSTGYRAGGFNTRGFTDATLTPFFEESVITYELGHKADWDLAWAAVRTNLAVYLQSYEDIHQTRSFDGGNGALITKTENAAKAEIKGLEFDVTVAPSENLEFNLSYSYVDAAFKEKTDLIRVAGVNTEVDTSGDDFTYIPKQSATVSATYTLPVDASLGEMSVTAGYYWQDSMTSHALIDEFGIMPGRSTSTWSAANIATATEVSEIDAYGVMNLRYDWRAVMGSSFDVAAYVDNVNDEEYVLGGLNVIDSGGYTGYTYGAPRTVGASVRYTF